VFDDVGCTAEIATLLFELRQADPNGVTLIGNSAVMPCAGGSSN
jgi:hypothetical protein